MQFQIYASEPQFVTKDASQTIDWGVNVVQAPMLWGTVKGEGLKVAILDTGVDRNHPDLVANIKGGINFTTADRDDWQDRQGHGTHCAGIIGAVDNGIGVIGVAPAVELYAVKVLGDNGSGGFEAIVQGLDWCIANGIDIASMSLGASGDPGTDLHDAIKRARAAGIIIVAASGNEATQCGWPAAYEECIAVGAVDAAFDKANFSNFGSEVDVAAPGVDIFSTYKDGQYAKLSGTSMATPIVSGCVAIVQCLCRKMGVKATPDKIVEMLSAKSVDLGTDGRDVNYGAGLINLYKLLAQHNG
jgi:subtilisin family serine protease